MFKYSCLIIFIMSSFGWTQKPIEFHKVTTYPNNEYRIKDVEYFKVNKDNKIERTRWVKFHYDKQIEEDIPYVNGESHGKFMSYYEDGSIMETGNYKNGKREGRWYEYYGDGGYRELLYKNHREVENKYFPPKSD